uniref:Uncharacterized protein n=1 Tax=Anopheles melas TaxID=34690 RepID=A0A182TN00_9DIPT
MIRSEVLLAVVALLLPLLLAIIAGDCCSDLPFVPLGHLDALPFGFLARLTLGLLALRLLPSFLFAPLALLLIPSACLLDGLLEPLLLHASLFLGQPDRFLFQLAQALFFLQDALPLGLLLGLDTLALQFRQSFGFLARQTTTLGQCSLCFLLRVDALGDHGSGHCVRPGPGYFNS